MITELGSEVTVPHRVGLIWPRTQALWSFTWSPAVNFNSYRGIGSRKCSFPAKCVGIFDNETFTEVRKWCGFSFAWKIAARTDCRGANRLWVDNGRNLSVQAWLRLRTLKTRNFRNGKISSKRHKNTPEVSHFHPFYWMNVKLSVF